MELNIRAKDQEQVKVTFQYGGVRHRLGGEEPSQHSTCRPGGSACV